MGFIHINCHSEYSVINGTISIADLVRAAAKCDMPAVALCDHMNLFAAIKFYREAIALGIKPIIGSDVLIATDKMPYSCTLLCQNQMGYRNLSALISLAYTTKQACQALKKSWLLEYNAGLIMIVKKPVVFTDTEELDFFQKIFVNRLYLEITRIGQEREATNIADSIKLATQYSLPLVASNAVCFLHADDYEAHKARVAIHEGELLVNSKAIKAYTEHQYFKSGSEMQQLFQDIPEAITNSYEIAKRCNLTFALNKVYMPNFEVPKSFTVEEYLASQAAIGLKEKISKLNLSQELHDKYFSRLQHEIKVINSMGFAGYFLIVADFINWAVTNKIAVGPGRGSGAGSLVAYSLGITGLDPIAYDLLFERFLNPERVSMPDFDIDFCMDGRDRVIEYVAHKYGRDAVSQIITFGTMAAKAVVRDVGRVLGYTYGFVDKLSKLIPNELGITLEKALNTVTELARRYQTEDEVKSIIDLAVKLEGIVRNVGKHAGGVVIAPSKIIDFMPVYVESNSTEDKSASVVCQFDKDDVEAIGLVKFDFLGLKTLTIINHAVDDINQSNPNALIDINALDFKDAKTFKLLQQSKTSAVFQLESRGMKDLIAKLKPDCLEDIIALVALFRPGPLQSGMVDDFINRKLGKSAITYAHEKMSKILKPTYGVILYQEQVMQIAQELAGYSLGAADLLRRAMGKKKPEEMAKQRAIFTSGAVERGIDVTLANSIFDLMEKFAGYGFNKSHSAAYGILTFQTAWLKAHYPAEFMAAVLSADLSNTDKIVYLIDECRALKLKIHPPNVNKSAYRFSVIQNTDSKIILYGLGAIKGIGEALVANIIAEREKGGEFLSLLDFLLRLDNIKLSKRTIEILIKAGACDTFGITRDILIARLPKITAKVEQKRRDDSLRQQDLFGMPEDIVEDAEEYDEKSDVNISANILEWEKEALGLYFSGHPIDRYKTELQNIRVQTLSDMRVGKTLIAGFIQAIRTIITRNEDRMAFVTLDDNTARQDIMVPAELYKKSAHILTKDSLVIMQIDATQMEDSERLRIRALKILDFGNARMEFAQYLAIECTENFKAPDLLKTAFNGFMHGKCGVRLIYKLGAIKTELCFGKKWCVVPNDELLSKLNSIAGINAALVY